MSNGIVLMMAAAGQKTSRPLTLVFEVFGDLTEEERTVAIALGNTSGDQWDCEVDWGDGTVEAFQYPDTPEHIYATIGQYTVRVTGSVDRLGRDLTVPSYEERLIKCLDFGDVGLASISRAFYECVSLVQAPDELPSTVTEMNQAFWDAIAFNYDIGGWDTSAITSMASAFSGAEAFNQDIGGWDTSSVVNMQGMFQDALAFNQDIGSWDTSSVQTMDSMFDGAAAFNQDISGWDVSTVTNMASMFAGATSFQQDLDGWDTSSVLNMQSMFRSSSYNGDISGWDTSAVTDMTDMFASNSAFNQDLTGWCVTNIPSEPDQFDDMSGLSPSNLPVWGTCP